MIYLLDANTYIEAKNSYYSMDFCPAYWSWLDHQFATGIAGSIDMIGRELKDGNDELAEWVKARKGQFIANDDATQTAFMQIIEYVMAQNFNPANRDNFLAKADPWLIAKAMSSGAIVVTHESLVSDATKKVKVPNICKQFGVQCINTFEFLRQTKAKFGLI
ncbi:DUF4411 family protein [Alishewanella longhuensis]